MPDPKIVTLVCTRETFRPAPTESVRWLAPQADIYRVQQARRTEGQDAPTYEEWLEWHRQGYRFCAALKKGRIVAQAAVLAHSETDWELAAVGTLTAYRRQGYGRAAAAFITDFILEHQAQATCHTEATNTAMLRLAESLGYRRQ